jgi:YegS/Rv2252/BmrU family lipid kinase
VKPILLLINTGSRRGRYAFGEVIAQFNDLDVPYRIGVVRRAADLAQQIQHYADRAGAVVIGGGDGTLNAAADALIAAGLPLGIIPLGTANDLARTLGIPTDIAAACRVIAGDRRQRIDLGWVNGKHFFNVASLGLSVQVTELLCGHTKRRWGVLAYAVAALKALARLKRFSVQLRIDDQQPLELKTLQVAVGNGKYYGGGLAIAQEARIDDQMLSIYSLEVQHWWQAPLALVAIRRGHFGGPVGIRQFTARQVEVCTHRPKRINTDGEITAQTPALFRVLPEALEVFVPTESPPPGLGLVGFPGWRQ